MPSHWVPTASASEWSFISDGLCKSQNEALPWVLEELGTL